MHAMPLLLHCTFSSCSLLVQTSQGNMGSDISLASVNYEWAYTTFLATQLFQDFLCLSFSADASTASTEC